MFCSYDHQYFLEFCESNFSLLNGKYYESKMFQDIEFEQRESKSRGRILTFAIVNKGHDDLKWFFTDAFPYFDNQMSVNMEKYE